MGILKSTFNLSAVLVAALLVSAPVAYADSYQCEPVAEQDYLGGVDPFPLNCPLKFPWGTIEGNWEMKGAGVYAAYSFEVQNTCEGREILRIRKFDVRTGEVLSEGIGYKLANSQEVRAVMKGKTGNHMLHVGAYLNKTVSPAVPANVLRVIPFDPDKEGKAWEIIKFQRELRPRIHDKNQQRSLTCVDDRE